MRTVQEKKAVAKKLSKKIDKYLYRFMFAMTWKVKLGSNCFSWQTRFPKRSLLVGANAASDCTIKKNRRNMRLNRMSSVYIRYVW